MHFLRRFLIPILLAATLIPLWAPASFALEYRSVDGSGNNETHPEWGSALTKLRRVALPAYGDGVFSPAGSSRPGARVISNAVSAQNGSVVNTRFLTDMVWQWGQFLTHDTDLTETQQPADPFAIAIPSGDAQLDPFSEGTRTIRFFRSVYDPLTGSGAGNPRQQLNEVTSFIDASQVYGVEEDRAQAIRTFSGGKLKTSAGNLLPFNTLGFPNEIIGTNPAFFLTGDIRANEQLGLTSLHTLFVREHNRLVDEIASQEPGLGDEELYQRARRIVGAQMQVITFNEFLPALLGRPLLPSYRGYDPALTPAVSNEYATAAFRLHSMVSDRLLRLDGSGNPIPQGHLTLREASLAPQRLVETGIDPIIKGQCTQLQQANDLLAVDGIRNILFGPPGSPGTDVIAADIQRGRDHGLPHYNALRSAYGLSPVSSFAQLTGDQTTAAALADVYSSVNDVDAFVGMLAEKHVTGAGVGPLTQAIIVEQFRRMRDGDRFWHERAFSGKELRKIRSTRLSDIIKRNTGITKLQRDVFHNVQTTPLLPRF